jgi:Fic family protein
VSDDRHSQADPVELINDPMVKAQKEAENGVRQFKFASELIRDHILRPDAKFRLRQAHILRMHELALQGIHPLAGTYRNSRVFIGQSDHLPPKHSEVADHVADMCDFISHNWEEKNAIFLASYVLWRMNWIHPFADGNGRTARMVSYVVLSIKMDSLLPGTPTIPDQIASGKERYYSALEDADRAWRLERVDLANMIQMMESMLAKQLYMATEAAGI